MSEVPKNITPLFVAEAGEAQPVQWQNRTVGSDSTESTGKVGPRAHRLSAAALIAQEADSSQTTSSSGALSADSIVHAVLEARREGVAEGMRLAQQEMEAQARTEYLIGVERLASSIESVHGLSASLLEQSRSLVLDLALKLAQRILEQQIEVNPGVVMDLTKSMLKSIEAETIVTIKLHPVDYVLVKELPTEMTGIASFNVLADDSVDRGGCIIVTNNGELDGRLQTRLDNLGEIIRTQAVPMSTNEEKK